MDLRKYVYEYDYLKRQMEVCGELFGLTDRRTIELSQKLDSLINKIMSIKYPKLDHQKRLG